MSEAIGGSLAYDAQVQTAAGVGRDAEATFFDLALDDLRAAADMFRPIHERTSGVDGYVSLEVSPLLADDAQATLSEARRLSALGDRPNLLIKIPGTAQGLWAIEEAIFAGIPINVTLLFSPAQYLATAEAYTRGIERRVDAGLTALVPSVASVFVSRWDAMPEDPVPAGLKGGLGLASAGRCTRRTGVLRVRPLATSRQSRRATPAAAVRQHRDQGSQRSEDTVRGGPCGTQHGRHDA